MLMVELHKYPVGELSYASSSELMGPEELDGFHHQRGFLPTQYAGKPRILGCTESVRHLGMYTGSLRSWSHGECAFSKGPW